MARPFIRSADPNFQELKAPFVDGYTLVIAPFLRGLIGWFNMIESLIII